MYTFINTRVIGKSGGSAALYRRPGGFTVTVFMDSPNGVSYDFDTRAEAVSWREILRKK